MKRLYFLLAFLIAMLAAGDGSAQRSRHYKGRQRHRTHRVAKKKHNSRSKRRTARVAHPRVASASSGDNPQKKWRERPRTHSV